MPNTPQRSYQRGLHSPVALLEAEEVVALRRRYRAGGVTFRELAAEFGISHTTAVHAINGVRYNEVDHVEPPRRPKQTKLNRELVIELRKARKRGVSFTELASLTGFTVQTIQQAVRGISWKSVNAEEPPAPSGDFYYSARLLRRFSADQIREIRSRRAAGETGRALAAAFDTHRSVIYRICRRETYAEVDADGAEDGECS